MGSHRSEARAVLDPLRLLVRALRVSSRDAERQLGVSGAQLFVLQSLDEIGAASINELAAATHTDQSSVSVVVKRLADASLVSRRRAAVDGRRVEIKLTARGETLLRRAPETPQSRMVRALVAMPAARRRSLARSLAELAAAAGVKGAPEMFFEPESRA